MASDYGLNFGFRRSDESMLSGREGRLKVPVAATDWKQGDFVTFDPANPGFMKKAAADTPIEPGFSGFIIQEDAWDVGIHENQVMNSYYLSDIKPNRLAAIWTGAGVKVWLKNTDAVARVGGIARAAVTRFTMGVTAVGPPATAPLTIGDYISWNGTTYVKAGSAAVAVARVTLSNGTNYIEATWLA